MQRRFGVLAVISALLLIASQAQAADPPPTVDHLRAYSVLPAGQNGFVSLADALGSTYQPHFLDQLEMYEGLIEDDDVSEEDLSVHFKSFAFGPGAAVEREYSPKEGVTIFRDDFGVPHIYGTTDLDAFFGTGYATAEDRLWQMDLFRHAATGRLAELLGEGFVETDRQTRLNGYTTAELQTMIDALPPVAGVGAADIIDAYVDGINARIAEVVGDINATPAEYQGAPIEEWAPSDVAAVAVFQLRSFGETGGAELEHAAYLQALRKELGRRRGNKVFRDLTYQNDPDSRTTIPDSVGPFPSSDFGPRDGASIALPDNSKQYVGALAAERKSARTLQRLLGLPTRQSNFAAVGPEMSATGNPLEWGAPQVGYQVPQFFLELDVHSPNFDYRGPAVPGASVLIPLGRGIDYAWSLTTGASDNVDTRVELLCQDEEHYMFQGECVAMDKRTETITIGTTPVPTTEEMTVYRTVHGPVRAFGTVKGEPVAIVQQRSFWMQELETIVAFATLNSNQTSTPEDFFAALEQGTMSFNAVFANGEHIAYTHAGLYPIRPTGMDPFLPTWGTGEWEWEGQMAPADLPRMIDPPNGWLVNWNNRPSTGWKDGDSSGWGATHRVGLLEEALGARAQNATLSDVVDAARIVATQDARGYYLAPMMTEMAAGMKGNVGAARDAVISWADGGAHRLDQDDDGQQDFGPGVAVFDVWYEKLVRRIFKDELGKALKLSVLPISDDAARSNGSSYYSDFSTYLWHLLQSDDFHRFDYCDNIDTRREESCRKIVRRSLKKAAAALSQQQGDSVSAWTAPVEKIEFAVIGAKGVADIDWQNRGTWNHAVEVTGSR